MGEIIDFDKYKEKKRLCNDISNKDGYENSVFFNDMISNSDTSTSLHAWLRDIYKDIGKNIDKENK